MGERVVTTTEKNLQGKRRSGMSAVAKKKRTVASQEVVETEDQDEEGEEDE